MSMERRSSLTGRQVRRYHCIRFEGQHAGCPNRSPHVWIADVAQLVEQLFRKQQVARSIRVVGSIHRIQSIERADCGGCEGGVPPSWGSYKGAWPPL